LNFFCFGFGLLVRESKIGSKTGLDIKDILTNTLFLIFQILNLPGFFRLVRSLGQLLLQ